MCIMWGNQLIKTRTDMESIDKRGSRQQGGIFFYLFLSSYFYPGWHPCGQAGWLPTTQVLKGSLLLESGKNKKEKQKVRVATKSGSN